MVGSTGFSFAEGEFFSLDYPEAILTYATGINDRGEIVGRWDSADGHEHGFHWRDGIFKILDVPDAVQTLPDGVNDRGDVVGRTTIANGSVLAFHRRDGIFQTFGYPGARVTVARGINENGDIVGRFVMPDGKVRGFVLHAKRVDEIAPLVDHLVYATPDLDRGVDEIEKLLGVRATFGGKHPGRGTKNALIALGPNSFLEIVAPDPDQPAPKDPRPFFKGLTESRLVRWFINSRDIGTIGTTPSARACLTVK
jgi:probable HAF family extracellular repeat protein